VVRSLYHALMLKRLIIVAVLIQGPLRLPYSVEWVSTFFPFQVTDLTPFGAKMSSVVVPALASWKSKDSLPERFADYDDSGAAWVGKLLI
jgi:hypothetical protein